MLLPEILQYDFKLRDGATCILHDVPHDLRGIATSWLKQKGRARLIRLSRDWDEPGSHFRDERKLNKPHVQIPVPMQSHC